MAAHYPTIILMAHPNDTLYHEPSRLKIGHLSVVERARRSYSTAKVGIVGEPHSVFALATLLLYVRRARYAV
jgi:hypothetical protein